MPEKHIYVVFRSTDDYEETHPEFVAAFDDEATATAYAENRTWDYERLWVSRENLNPAIPETTAKEEREARLAALPPSRFIVDPVLKELADSLSFSPNMPIMNALRTARENMETKIVWGEATSE